MGIIWANTLCFGNDLQRRMLQRIASDARSDEDVFILTTRTLGELPCLRDHLHWIEQRTEMSWRGGSEVQVVRLPPVGSNIDRGILERSLQRRPPGGQVGSQ